jgi:hypothetical protein
MIVVAVLNKESGQSNGRKVCGAMSDAVPEKAGGQETMSDLNAGGRETMSDLYAGGQETLVRLECGRSRDRRPT